MRIFGRKTLGLIALSLVFASGCSSQPVERSMVGTWNVLETPGDTWSFSENHSFVARTGRAVYGRGNYVLIDHGTRLKMRMSDGGLAIQGQAVWIGDSKVSVTSPGVSVTLQRL
jgi:hypothetical protein